MLQVKIGQKHFFASLPLEIDNKIILKALYGSPPQKITPATGQGPLKSFFIWHEMGEAKPGQFKFNRKAKVQSVARPFLVP